MEGHRVCFPDWLLEPRGALAKARHPWAELRKAVGLQDMHVSLLCKSQEVFQIPAKAGTAILALAGFRAGVMGGFRNGLLRSEP